MSVSERISKIHYASIILNLPTMSKSRLLCNIMKNIFFFFCWDETFALSLLLCVIFSSTQRLKTFLSHVQDRNEMSRMYIWCTMSILYLNTSHEFFVRCFFPFYSVPRLYFHSFLFYFSSNKRYATFKLNLITNTCKRWILYDV